MITFTAMSCKKTNIVGQCYMLPRGGGDSAYERGGDTHQKFGIKPLKETDLGVAEAFLIPKRDHVKTQTIHIFLYFFHVQP